MKVRAEALVRITDQSVLREIAKDDPEESIRISAVRKITDVDFLTDIAMNTRNGNVGEVAVKKPGFRDPDN